MSANTGFSPSHNDGFGCGNKSEAGQYYLVAVFHACSYDGRVQRCRSRVHGNSVFYAREFRKILLELGDHWTRAKPAC